MELGDTMKMVACNTLFNRKVSVIRNSEDVTSTIDYLMTRNSDEESVSQHRLLVRDFINKKRKK